MKHLKLFENFENKKTIRDYPQSVHHIYKSFSLEARKSIDDNLEKFSKIAKKVFYNKDKNWKDYFSDKKIKELKTLTDVIDSLESWLEK